MEQVAKARKRRSLLKEANPGSAPCVHWCTKALELWELWAEVDSSPQTLPESGGRGSACLLSTSRENPQRGQTSSFCNLQVSCESLQDQKILKHWSCKILRDLIPFSFSSIDMPSIC